MLALANIVTVIRVIRGEIIYFIEITHSSDFVQSSIVIVSLSVRFCICYKITFLQDYYIDAVLNELTVVKLYL